MALAKPVRSAVPVANTLPEEHHFSTDENDAKLVVLTDMEKIQDEFEYPEGGAAAWAVAAGSWCAMTAGLGIVNSTGVFEAYLSNTILSGSSTNAIGWIMGVYVFVSYFFGVQIGPIFDARGPRELIFIGTVCLIVGTFTLAQCTGQSGSIQSLKTFLRKVVTDSLSRATSLLPNPLELFHVEWHWKFVPLYTGHGRNIPLV